MTSRRRRRSPRSCAPRRKHCSGLRGARRFVSPLEYDSFMSRPLSIALDYSVIDHLHRVATGSYKGADAIPLLRLRAAAETGMVETWGAEITFVEMLLGVRKVAEREEALRTATAKDVAKRAIMQEMRVRRLGYPASRCDDGYSLLGYSMRCAGPHATEAIVLEERLRRIPGVSEGDARQLVSCAYPFDGDTLTFSCHLDWFVSEDGRLVRAINSALATGEFSELAHLRFGTVRDLVAANPESFDQPATPSRTASAATEVTK